MSSGPLPIISNISNIKNSVAMITTLLPKSKRNQKEAILNTEIQSLTEACNQKIGQVFKNKVHETKTAILEEKQLCKQDLLLMNGSYYQDPRSALKTAWDQLVESVDQAISFKIEKADQLDQALEQLNIEPNQKKQSAQRIIVHYRALESIRNNRQTQLDRILATEKATENSDDLLKQKKELLKQRHQELCGDYFGDPKGQLDQAWQKYQTALKHGATGEMTLDTYQALDGERKQIEAQLYDIEQQFSAPASNHRTFDQLTVDAIHEQVKEFKALPLQKTKVLVQANLMEIAARATKTALTNAGYIYIPQTQE